MQLRYASLVAVPLLALAVAAPASAQGRLSVTPLIGGYIPGDDIYEVADAAERVSIEKEATLAFGLNVEFGMLRGSLAYATGATISEEGQSGDIGEGSVLAATADVVLRPIPRMVIVQPYLLGGVGLKRTDYDWASQGIADAFPDDQSDFTLHLGVGADVMLGPMGLVVEVSDFISKQGDDDFGRHDAFGMLGLKFVLF